LPMSSCWLLIQVNLLTSCGKNLLLRMTHFGIAEETGLSHSSVSRVMEPLIKLGIVKEQKVGKVFRTFMLNEENELTMKLLKFYKETNKFLGV